MTAHTEQLAKSLNLESEKLLAKLTEIHRQTSQMPCASVAGAKHILDMFTTATRNHADSIRRLQQDHIRVLRERDEQVEHLSLENKQLKELLERSIQICYQEL